jgi:hypothetical protein
MAKAIPVYVEAGDKKVFACSIDFPGWCRSDKTEELALEALAAYAPRYAEVAERAKAAFPAPAKAGERFEVVERVKGKGATDFGIPHEIPEADAEPLTSRQAARQVELLRAPGRRSTRSPRPPRPSCARPTRRRPGPDKMLGHCSGPRPAYARNGVKLPPEVGDQGHQGLQAGPGPRRRLRRLDPPEGWPPRYAIRRIAWRPRPRLGDAGPRRPDG